MEFALFLLFFLKLLLVAYVEAPSRTWTDDPFITSEVLYQLSYWSRLDYYNEFDVILQFFF